MTSKEHEMDRTRTPMLRPNVPKAGSHPLGWTDYYARLVSDLEAASQAAITAIGNPAADEGVRAAAVKHVCRSLARTVARLDQETDQRPIFFDDRARWTGIPGRLQRCWQRLDTLASRLTNRAVNTAQTVGRPLRARLQRDWWWQGLVLTGAVMWAVLTQNYTAALALLLLRWTGSLIAGGPTVSMGAPEVVAVEEEPDIRRHLLTSCVAAHGSDLLLIVAAAGQLIDMGAPGWALGTMAAGALGSFATLFRIAAERNGAQVKRSVIERFARNGGAGVALGAGALSATQVMWLAVPPLGILGVAFAAYAVVEVFRIIMALHYDPRPEIAIILTVDEDNTPRVSGVRRPDMSDRRPVALV
jgi:hypothetical protein